MVSTVSLSPGEYVPTADQRIVLSGVTWERYEVELTLRGERPVPRLAFLEGTLELMSPSKDHERLASWIGRLVEVFAEERDIELSPYGSWTLKNALRAAGAEPDECYIFGPDQSAERPDLVIEVVWTSGGLDKLDIYSRLGVSEVWFWIDGKLELHVLERDGYQRVSRSQHLRDLDPDQLCSFLDRRSVHVAKREYRAALRGAHT